MIEHQLTASSDINRFNIQTDRQTTVFVLVVRYTPSSTRPVNHIAQTRARMHADAYSNDTVQYTIYSMHGIAYVSARAVLD